MWDELASDVLIMLVSLLVATLAEVLGGGEEWIEVAAVGGGADQVWSLTQFYSVDYSKSRIGVKKCVFNKRTIKVCVSCC